MNTEEIVFFFFSNIQTHCAERAGQNTKSEREKEKKKLFFFFKRNVL
jgi:hypothetical protein